jgi:hypothetical protein
MTNEPPQDDPEQATPPPPAPAGPPPGPPPTAGPPPGYPQAPAYPQPGTQSSASPPPGGYGPPPTGAPPGPPSGYGPPPQSPPPQGPAPGYRPQPPAPGYAPPPQAPGYGAPQGQGYGTPPPGYGGPPPQGPPAGYGTPPPGYGAAQPPAGDPRWSSPTTAGSYPSPTAGPDFKAVNPLDWGILAAGVLAMIFSFFGYYTASVQIGSVSISSSEGAWHGFFGWFAALVAFLAAGVLAVALFAPQSLPSIPHRLITVGGFAVATICVLLALVVFPHSVPSGSGIDTGRGVGYWLSLIVIVAGLVLSVIRLRATGGKLPWDKGGRTPPAAGGYAPPS